ncbi:MAG: RNA polymerase sigma factor [Bacteroides sp.]|nr:RNA polymerase sigma factor [Bacteroides sp.]
MNKPSSHEENNFLEHIRKYGGIITRLCYYYAENEDDFRDLRQDVLATLWEARDKYQGLSSSSTWIYRVTLNVCVSAFRKSTRKKKIIQRLDKGQDYPFEEDFKTERLKTMHRMINRLPEQDKAILLLWLDDLKYEEISDITGLQRNTLATRLRRIKEKICKMTVEL